MASKTMKPRAATLKSKSAGYAAIAEDGKPTGVADAFSRFLTVRADMTGSACRSDAALDGALVEEQSAICELAIASVQTGREALQKLDALLLLLSDEERLAKPAVVLAAAIRNDVAKLTFA